MLRALVLGTAVAGLFAGGAMAADENLFHEYRESVMKSFGAHMGALKVALTEEKSLTADAAANAKAIEVLSATIVKMFPEGSASESALPAIWSDSAGFAAAAKKNEELAAALATAAASGDNAAAVAAFGALGKDGCGGCHASFRKKE